MIVERLPDWFKQRIRTGPDLGRVLSVLDEFKLNTVCESALCPNRGHCYSSGTATFMILGSICTRDCCFCAVEKGKPQPVDKEEPERLSLAAAKLGLKYVVITSVSRDDLADGGAGEFAETIRRIRTADPAVIVEILVPDFRGNPDSLKTVMEAHPDVIGHNLETTPCLYPRVRPKAVYGRSVELLARAKTLNPGIMTKSGLMLGLGETEDDVRKTFGDLSDINCDILTIGQYLQPSPEHLPVAEYIRPEQFQKYRITALDCGFKAVASAPLVRSSYNAEEIFMQAKTA